MRTRASRRQGPGKGRGQGSRTSSKGPICPITTTHGPRYRCIALSSHPSTTYHPSRYVCHKKVHYAKRTTEGLFTLLSPRVLLVYIVGRACDSDDWFRRVVTTIPIYDSVLTTLWSLRHPSEGRCYRTDTPSVKAQPRGRENCALPAA